ncbi:MAG: WD40 repeat domain-containing protein [Alphaproteobacteria bacterium]|nr:WD40 repeat domain-containing protein [Alphaproteobacteria bacterium]
MHWFPLHRLPLHWILLASGCGRGLPGPPPEGPISGEGSSVSPIRSTSSTSLPLAVGALELAPLPPPAARVEALAELPAPAFADPMGWSEGSLAITGERILSGGEDGRLRLLDPETGAVLASLPGHAEAITQLRALPGDRVLSGDAEGALRLWDLSGEVPRGAELLVQHASPILTLEVDPSGALALSGDARGNVVLWDLAGGQPLRVLGGEESSGDGVVMSSGEGLCAAFSPDGARLALAGGAGFRVYDTRSGEVLGGASWDRLSARPAAALAMLDVDRVRVLHGLLEGDTPLQGDGPVMVSDWSLSGERLDERVLRWVEGAAMRLSPDGRRVALSTWRGGLSLWEPDSEAEPRRILDATEEIGRLAFSPGGERLAFGGGWRPLNLVELASGRLAHPGGPALPRFLSPVDLSEQGVAALGADERLWLWTPGEPLRSFGLGVDAVSFVQGGERVAALGDAAWVLELDSGALLFEHLGELGYVTGTDLDASADGAVLVLGEYEGHLSVLDGQTGALRSRVETDDGELYSLRVRADGRAMASVGSMQHLRVRALPSGELLLDVPLEDGSEIMGWGGGQIAVTGDEVLELYDAGSGAMERVAEDVRWSAVALSEDGRWLAWCHEDGRVVLLDRRSGARHAFLPQEGPAQAMAFDPAGERLLMTWAGGLARVYAVETLQDLDTIEITEKSSPTMAPEVRALRTPTELLPEHARARLPELSEVQPGLSGQSVIGLSEGRLLELSLPKGELLAERDLPDSYPELAPASGGVLLRADGLELLGPGLKGRALGANPGGPAAVSPDGQALAVAEQGALRILDPEGELLRERPQAYADYANVVAWSPDGRHVAVAGTDLIVRVWRAEDLSLVAAFRAMAEVRDLLFLSEQAVAWTADANRVSPGLAIGRWGEGPPERQVLHMGWGVGPSLVLRPDGRLLAVTDDAGVRFYDTDTGAYLARLPTPSRPGELAFSPDGTLLVTTAWGEGALVWELTWLP